LRLKKHICYILYLYNVIGVGMSKLGKVLLSMLILMIIFVIIILCYVGYVISNTPALKLNLNALQDYNTQLTLYDHKDEPIHNINSNGNLSINIDELPEHTIDAFLAIEDHKFYQHNGLNFGRIIRATLNNIVSGSPKEGASTITQQLIKNTHLSSEKTLDRKIKEAYLALQLEQKFSKDQILSTYLNILYFGNGLYGIESASRAFFGHSASTLSISESAILAGIIKSPATYSPISNYEKSIQRRNIVLDQMLKYNKISADEYNIAINQKNTIIQVPNKSHYMYSQMVYRELMDILDLNEVETMNKGLHIYTYFDDNAQLALDTGFDTLHNSAPKQDKIMMMLDNSNSGVIAYSGTKIDNTHRQCGSLIKPILCYGSALEKHTLYPISQILDEEIDYNGYSPQNVDNIQHGWVSLRYALAHSLNIPAVKTLDYVGLDYALKFAKKFGIEFTQNDNHLALALGAMEHGTTVQQIANAYSTFANSGQYTASKFIKKIVDRDGNVIYSHQPTYTTACSQNTAFLINDFLLDCSSEGTAKKIGMLDKNIASKTGTVGTVDQTNSDAWCVSYTPEYTWVSWCGNTTADTKLNLSKNQNGGTICCNSLFTTIKNMKNLSTTNFIKPENVKLYNVDKEILLNEHRVALTDLDSGYSDYFVQTHLPPKTNINSVTKFIITHNADKQSIIWEKEKGVQYIVYVSISGKITQIPYQTNNNFNSAKISPDTNKVWVQRITPTSTTNSNVIEFYTQATKTSILKKMGKIWLR